MIPKLVFSPKTNAYFTTQQYQCDICFVNNPLMVLVSQWKRQNTNFIVCCETCWLKEEDKLNSKAIITTHLNFEIVPKIPPDSTLWTYTPPEVKDSKLSVYDSALDGVDPNTRIVYNGKVIFYEEFVARNNVIGSQISEKMRLEHRKVEEQKLLSAKKIKELDSRIDPEAYLLEVANWKPCQ